MALLKHKQPTFINHMGSVYPSLKSDGSIEAEGKCASLLAGGLTYPSLKSDGSIEAFVAQKTEREKKMYPSLKSDGSIEAI